MRHRGTTITNKLDRQTWPTTPSQTTHHTAIAFRPLTMKPPEYIKPPLSPTSDHFCLTKFHQPVKLVDACITTPHLRQNILIHPTARPQGPPSATGTTLEHRRPAVMCDRKGGRILHTKDADFLYSQGRESQRRRPVAMERWRRQEDEEQRKKEESWKIIEFAGKGSQLRRGKGSFIMPDGAKWSW